MGFNKYNKKIDGNKIINTPETILIYEWGSSEIKKNIVLNITKDFPFFEGLLTLKFEIKSTDVNSTDIEYK